MARTRDDRTWQRRGAAVLVVTLALGGATAWQTCGRQLCREVWRGIAGLLALEPTRAVAVVTGLLGG